MSKDSKDKTEAPVVSAEPTNSARKLPLRPIIYVVALIILITIAVAVASHNDSSKNTTKNKTGSYGINKTAVQILTPIDAYNQIGNNGYDSAEGKKADSTKDVKISKVTYYKTGGKLETEPNSPIPKQKELAALVVKSPLTKGGVSTVKNDFNNKPSNSEELSKFGDAAYWNPKDGTLNVLKHNTWYVVSTGSPTASERKLDTTKKFAAKLLPNM